MTEAAHGEVSHRGVFAVVWKLVDDGVSWSAVRAGDEEIIVSSIFWLSEFGEAFVAYGDVRWNN